MDRIMQSDALMMRKMRVSRMTSEFRQADDHFLGPQTAYDSKAECIAAAEYLGAETREAT